jgi:hypothetical protein
MATQAKARTLAPLLGDRREVDRRKCFLQPAARPNGSQTAQWVPAKGQFKPGGTNRFLPAIGFGALCPLQSAFALSFESSPSASSVFAANPTSATFLRPVWLSASLQRYYFALFVTSTTASCLARAGLKCLLVDSLPRSTPRSSSQPPLCLYLVWLLSARTSRDDSGIWPTQTTAVFYRSSRRCRLLGRSSTCCGKCCPHDHDSCCCRRLSEDLATT